MESGAPLRKKWLIPEEEVEARRQGDKSKPPSTALAAVASVSAALAGGDAAAASRAALAAFPAHLSPYALPSAAARRPVRHVSVCLEEARLGVGGGGGGGGNAAAATSSSASSAANAPSSFCLFFLLRARRPLLPRPLREAPPLPRPGQGRRGPRRRCLGPGRHQRMEAGSLAAVPDVEGGVLALEAADAAAHAAWALGLNAGLALSRVRRRGALLDSRARSVPRSPVFLVVGEEE